MRNRIFSSQAISLSLTVIIIAISFMAVAALNRLPVLFPDTLAYNSAGEAVLGVVQGSDRHDRHRITSGVRQVNDVGVSAARSPYYGVLLAIASRVGGVWFAAGCQALLAATGLVLALRRLRLCGSVGLATVVMTIAAGLAFYSIVLLPDVFLGSVILAIAFLVTYPTMSRGERLFWIAMLLGGQLFHRGFFAVALIMIVGSAAFWRVAWFSRRGWQIAAATTLIAGIGNAALAPVVEHVYHGEMASPPFLLARMAEGSVVPAYLADVCPVTPYLLCSLRSNLPMDHQQFLWAVGPDGAFNTQSLHGRQQLAAEAGPIIVGAVQSRPIAAVVEALRYAVGSFVYAGMDDFSQKVPTRWHIDPAFRSAMLVYPTSGIMTGEFQLHHLSRVTEIVYSASLILLATAAAVVAWSVGRRRELLLDQRHVAAIMVIFAGLITNAAVSGVISGLQDRYTGRVAWLAALAAAALSVEAKRLCYLRKNNAQ